MNNHMKLIPLILVSIMSTLSASTVYDHELLDIDGEKTSLSAHKGKVLLLVNVASRCGFTRQYKGLEELHQSYKDKGLVVCGFPCNQFGGQEPGSESEIKEFCSTKFGFLFRCFPRSMSMASTGTLSMNPSSGRTVPSKEM